MLITFEEKVIETWGPSIKDVQVKMAFFDPLPPVQICPFLADPSPLDIQVKKKFLKQYVSVFV
jgi:hypothetical protein